MDPFATFGSVLGLFGFILALGAWHKVGKLEADLKKRQLIDEKFDSDRA